MMQDKTNQAILDVFTVQAKDKARRVRDLQVALINEMAGLEAIAVGASHLINAEGSTDFGEWCETATITKDTLELCANSVGVDAILYEHVLGEEPVKNAPSKNQGRKK